MCDSMMGSMGMSGAGWMLSAVVMLVLFVGVVGLVVALVGTRRRPGVAAVVQGESGAFAVARERYARGEIDDVELDRILDTLLRTEGSADPGRR